MNKTILCLSILGVLVTLSACGNYQKRSDARIAASNVTGFMGRANSDYTDNDLARETYVTVDRILDQTNMLEGTPIPVIVATIANIDKMEKTDTFGRVVSEQVSSRLAQRGLTISELKLRKSVNIKQGIKDRTEGGEFMLSRDIDDIRTEYKVGYVLTGTYGVAGDEVMVNLKMLDIQSGHIVGASDFSVDIDANIKNLLRRDRGYSFYGNSMVN